MRWTVVLLFACTGTVGAADEPATQVLKALVDAAEQNARLPLASDPRAKAPYRAGGDELTEVLLRAAAAAADGLPKEQQASALLIALGIGLDNSTILRTNPLTSAAVRKVESDADRKKRLAVLGSPTMRGRRDLCQHFAVSCALTELLGPGLAEMAGVAKEVKDSQGTSGFSFIDLQADLSGIALATRVKKGAITVATLKKAFKVADHLPDLKGLREGLTAKQFEEDYGSLTDKRFTDELGTIRKRVVGLPAYRDLTEQK